MHTTERTTVGLARKAHHKPDGTGLPVRTDRKERIAAPSGAVILF